MLNPAPRAEYRASRPLALPLLSILIFCGGDLKKGMGGKGEGRLPLLKLVYHRMQSLGIAIEHIG